MALNIGCTHFLTHCLLPSSPPGGQGLKVLNSHLSVLLFFSGFLSGWNTSGFDGCPEIVPKFQGCKVGRKCSIQIRPNWWGGVEVGGEGKTSLQFKLFGSENGCGEEALEASFSFGFRYRFISAVSISACWHDLIRHLVSFPYLEISVAGAKPGLEA